MANLQRIDLPVVLEWLDDPGYLCHLTKRLLGPGSETIDIPTLRRTADQHDLDIRSTVTPAQRRYLRESNRWDIELYRFVCWWVRNELAADTKRTLPR